MLKKCYLQLAKVRSDFPSCLFLEKDWLMAKQEYLYLLLKLVKLIQF